MQNLQAPRKKSQGERVNDISDEVAANNTGTKGGREGAGGGRNVYSSRALELRGQLSPSDNSYCSNKVAATSSRGGNSSPKAVLVTHTHT